jgi:hypothetical protein
MKRTDFQRIKGVLSIEISESVKYCPDTPDQFNC